MTDLALNSFSYRPDDASVDETAKLFRAIERRRRTWRGINRLPAQMVIQMTASSFVLDGLGVAPSAIADASRPIGRDNGLRSRAAQRWRNHVAIINLISRRRRALRSVDVLRWYTSISSGLSTAVLSMLHMNRLEAAIDRVNSRQSRAEAALTEAAELYCELLIDPIFPSFNGIIARLLLAAQLKQSGLPPAIFDARLDADLLDPTRCVIRLAAITHTTLSAADRTAANRAPVDSNGTNRSTANRIARSRSEAATSRVRPPTARPGE